MISPEIFEEWNRRQAAGDFRNACRRPEAETDRYEAEGWEETLSGAVCQASQRGQKTLSSPEGARATIGLGHWQVGQLV